MESMCFYVECSFRFVSYNILADIYADSDFSRDMLFPYCPAYALDMNYRKLLLIKEITGKVKSFQETLLCILWVF
jgi:mRNA deadenylase 3'-5' endonuclease subunit Ccr4